MSLNEAEINNFCPQQYKIININKGIKVVPNALSG
jgi:hypothetical protein